MLATIIFIISCIISSLILFIGVYFVFKKNSSLEKVKTLATSIGMLGTFAGIFIALLAFNQNDISGSIPQLLGGLKTAFITSISGLVVSVLATFKERYESASDVEKNENQAENLQKEILEELKNLNKNIVGDGDSSLNTQVRNLRQDNSDNLKAIKSSFDDFAKQMAEQNIDALTKAIEQVMGEFNTTINDRLGEVFDNFRNSVDNLNRWQENYKQIIEDQNQNLRKLTDSYSVMTSGVERVSSSIEEMKVNYQKIAEINQTFDELVTKLNTQLGGAMELGRRLTELSESLEGSGEAIKREMQEITYTATNEMEKTMNQTLADFGSQLASISARLVEDFRIVQEALRINRNN